MKMRPHPLVSSVVVALTASAQGQLCTPEWSAFPPELAPNFDVLAFQEWHPPGVHEPVLVVAGSFWQIGQNEVLCIASWDGSTWTGLGQGLGGTVFTLTEYATPGGPTDLVAAGTFGGVYNGPTMRAIARWDGTTWHQFGDGLTHPVQAPSWPWIRTAAVLGSDLIVSGSMQLPGSSTTTGMARWDGAAWHEMESRLSYHLHIHDGELYAAGWWTNYGPSPVGVIRWTGQSWTPVGTNTFEDAFALGSWNGKLIATGLAGIAAWDGSTWQPLGSGINGAGRAITSFQPGPGHSELLVVGGSFTAAGGQPAARIAAWDGQNWHALGPGANDQVRALAVYQNQLYVGGWFTQAGGMPSPYLARWGCLSPPSCYPDCNGDSLLDIDDFVCFINSFAAGDPYADCDENGMFNIDDFLCFINEFAQGCP